MLSTRHRYGTSFMYAFRSREYGKASVISSFRPLAGAERVHQVPPPHPAGSEVHGGMLNDKQRKRYGIDIPDLSRTIIVGYQDDKDDFSNNKTDI